MHPAGLPRLVLVFTPGGILRTEFIRKGLLQSRDKEKLR